MNNSEWGAVAYLTSSRYGKYREIAPNNYYNGEAMTGCGVNYGYDSYYGGPVLEYGTHCSPTDYDCALNFYQSSTCIVQYGKHSLYSQSTTGNISGVFDMSGGVYEYVMANYSKIIASSGIGQDKFNLKGSYLNIYDDNSETLGDAFYETAGWYSDSLNSEFSASNPWYVRGGSYTQLTEQKNPIGVGIFSVANASGTGVSDRGFRMTLIPGIHSYTGELKS